MKSAWAQGGRDAVLVVAHQECPKKNGALRRR
jgi:hypothetical protein